MTADRFAALATHWNRRWLAGAAVAAAATGAVTGVAVLRLGGLAPTAAAAVAAVTALTSVAVLLRYGPRLDARGVARHLDRTVPAVEDSALLALAEPASLAPLEQLQRRRVLDRLSQTPAPHLPHRPWQRALRVAAALLCAAAALALWPPLGRSSRVASSAVSGAARTSGPAMPPQLIAVEIAVVPPTYTGRRSRSVRDWDVTGIEAGARLTWHITTAGAVTEAALITTAGDSVLLQPDGPRRWRAALAPEASRLYQVVAHGPGGRSATPYHRLLVVPDAPPVVAIVRPELRTTLAPGDSARLTLEALANDDYGLADAAIVATLTSGQGEAVKFRELRLPFAQRETRRGGGWRLRHTLDLDALGLGFGDELYFSVAVRDRRTPQPNESRSEVHFITRTDTAGAAASDFSGLALDVFPEYFRSQRQIIIDTERLLAERSRIARGAFRDRSQNIGIDQHLLRLRYGELVGDETETGDLAGVDEQGAPEVHQHDTEENATLLAAGVKRTLKAALAEMWDAELHLRTGDPATALPYEYRALELLKQVQQAARIYVRRSGFEPAPLEPDRNRLTGELDDIASRTRATARPPADTLPAVRAALAALAPGRDPADQRIPALEAAGRELARLAADDPARHLETLGALRELITSLERGGAPCTSCAARVASGLWAALPAPPPSPSGPPGAGTGVARAYRELLERAP